MGKHWIDQTRPRNTASPPLPATFLRALKWASWSKGTCRLSGKRHKCGDVEDVHDIGGFCSIGEVPRHLQRTTGCQSGKTIDVWLSGRISEVCAKILGDARVDKGRKNSRCQDYRRERSTRKFDEKRDVACEHSGDLCGIENFESNRCEHPTREIDWIGVDVARLVDES